MDKVKSQFDAAHDPLQRYRLYARGYGFVVVALLIIAAGVPAAGAGVSGVLALLSGVYLGGGGGARGARGRGLPHGVTAIRGAAASAIFASSAVLHVYGVSLGDGERWVILGIFTLVESTDLIDGILARRLGGGRPEEGGGHLGYGMRCCLRARPFDGLVAVGGDACRGSVHRRNTVRLRFGAGPASRPGKPASALHALRQIRRRRRRSCPAHLLRTRAFPLTPCGAALDRPPGPRGILRVGQPAALPAPQVNLI